MGWLKNVKNWVSIGMTDTTNHSVIGLDKKYHIDQSDKEWAFEEAFAGTSDVYSIVNKIAGNAKTVPRVPKLQVGDEITTLTSGDYYDIVMQPNPDQSMSQYAEEQLKHLLIGGNVYLKSIIPFSLSVPSETRLLVPQNIEIKTMLDGMVIVPKGYVYRIGGKEFKIESEKVTHLKYCNPTDYGILTLEGLSPVVASALTVIGLKNNQTASAAILEHQGASGILSNESEFPLNAEQGDEQQKILDKRLAGATLFGKVIQAMGKVKYTKLGLDPTQLKIIESKLLKMRDICNTYDVRSVLFNDLQGSTFANVAAAETQLWSGPIKANNDLVNEAFNREVSDKFTARDYPKGGGRYFTELDYSDVVALQTDKLKSANVDKAVLSGIDTVLKMQITLGAKALLLSTQYGIDIDTAKILVSPEGMENKTLETLKSLSPLLANKLVEKLSEEEIRALLF